MNDALSEARLKLAIVTPVFNDWGPLEQLLVDLDAHLKAENVDVHVIAVDDGSLVPAPAALMGSTRHAHLQSLEILTLACNLGHQRAIAVALADVATRKGFDVVIVMDCDGEDRPEAIPALLAEHWKQPGAFIVAARAKRSEGALFTFNYALYKFIFRLLTGKTILFGNFCLIPFGLLQILVFMPSLWNHLAATLLFSRLPLLLVPTVRGTRYAGKSSMNLVSLTTHGLSAISVFIDAVFTRLLFACLIIIAVSAVAAGSVIAIRLMTTLATPGWATTLVTALTIIALQAGLLVTCSAFLALAGRSNIPVVPARCQDLFIASRNRIY